MGAGGYLLGQLLRFGIWGVFWPWRLPCRLEQGAGSLHTQTAQPQPKAAGLNLVWPLGSLHPGAGFRGVRIISRVSLHRGMTSRADQWGAWAWLPVLGG